MSQLSLFIRSSVHLARVCAHFVVHQRPARALELLNRGCAIIRSLVAGSLSHSAGETPTTLPYLDVVVRVPGPIQIDARDKVQRKLLTLAPDDPLASVLRRVMTPDTAFLDIGANVGMYSLLCAAFCPEAQVYAFEPNPSVLEMLRTNVARGKSVTVFPVALGDRAGSMDLYFEPNQSGRASLNRPKFSRKVSVEVARLDDVLDVRSLSFRRCVIKIDVEEHEPAVLAGMAMWLSDGRPMLIALEARPHTLDSILFRLPGFTALGFDMQAEADPSVAHVRRRKYTNVLFANAAWMLERGATA